MQLIVLGMHRSGTSSVTRLLNMAGAYFGPEGVATDANDENPKGFWERRDVRQVCDGLLHGGGFDWWRVADFDADAIPEEIRTERSAAFGQIVYQLDAHRPWVMKEPRLCLLLPVLRPVLEAPVFVHVVREPIEIAESLATRNDFPVPVGLGLWEAYTRAAFAATTGEPRVLVGYGELIADPVGTTHRLIEELTSRGVQGLRVPTAGEITAFVSPRLHRQRQASGARDGYLNAQQVALADALDEGRFPDHALGTELSMGAQASLRSFEASTAAGEALEANLEAQRIEAQANLAQAEVARHQMEAELRAALAQSVADAAAEAQAARDVERQAIDALGLATDKVRAVKTSRALRLGTRITSVRGRLRRRPAAGADQALDGALKLIDRARGTLEEHAEAAPSPFFEAGAGDPPPVEELQRGRAAARVRGDRAKVAVLAWDVGHNPFGRAHLLADLLRDHYDVELWGPQFDRYGTGIWPPLRDTSIPVRRFRGGSFPEFLTTMDDMARRIDADALWVSKPRLPSLGLGALAKEHWNRPLLVDVDDFELSFFDETTGIALDDLLHLRGDDDLTLPFGRSWTRACDGVITSADQVTVSNLELQARYGGLLVPHARDEAVFDPARYDRGAMRRRLGLRDTDRLVLFGGTPRAHKGIVELLEAVDELGDQRVRVAAFGTQQLEELRPQIGPLERWLLPLPYQSFAGLPALLAAADLTCALQSPEHPVSRYQMPAKVTDAIAMGLPCLVTPVAPLRPLIDKDVVEVFDGDTPLHERLREIFADEEATADRARRGREVFLETHSYAAVRPAAVAAIEALLESPPPVAPALSALLRTTRTMFQPEAAPAPVVRRPLPAGTTYDLVMFWKQNDSGIYGRRQDMFLKYLEQSGRFRTIVHFDQPMTAENLARVARRSLGSLDQNRFVLAQTLRRVVRRADRGSIRQRTYVYAGGAASRSLRFPARSRYAAFVRSVLQREGFGGQPLMVWAYPTSTFLPEVIDALAPDVVVTDVVDDNRTWYAPGTPMYEQLDRNYAEVLARSDVVLANCAPVAESMRAFTPRVEVVPNACELPDPTPTATRPSELAGLPEPIIGYAGNLSDRIDLDLLRELVRARPQWSFVFLGSTHLDRSALQLAEAPNVRFVGTKPYEEAKRIIRSFDVALIPHLDNDMTQSMNPLKAYVYCSLGVPVVSTPVANLGELAEYMTIAEGSEQFLVAIDAALAAGHRAPDIAALRPLSWVARVERVLELVDDVVSARVPESG